MKKKIIAVCAALIVIGAIVVVYNTNKNDQPKEGYKEIKITVVDQDNNTVLDETFETDASNLTEFLENTPKLKTEIEQSDYGSLLTSIYGLDQDMDNGPWLVFESDNNKTCQDAGYCPAMDEVNLDNNDEFTFKQITSFE